MESGLSVAEVSHSTADLWKWALNESAPDRPWNRLTLNTARPTRNGGRELHPGLVHSLDVEMRRQLFAEQFSAEARDHRAQRQTRADEWNAAHPHAKASAARMTYEVGGGLPVQRALRRMREAKKPGTPHSLAFRIVHQIVDGRYESAEQLAAVMGCGPGRVMRLAGIGLHRLYAAYLDELRAMSVITEDRAA